MLDELYEPDLILIYNDGTPIGVSFKEFEECGGIEEAIKSGYIMVFHKSSCKKILDQIGFEDIPIEVR